MPILGQKHCVLGLGGQFKAPNLFSQLLHSQKHVFQHMGAEKPVNQGRPTEIEWPEMPIWGQKQWFLGSDQQC